MAPLMPVSKVITDADDNDANGTSTAGCLVVQSQCTDLERHFTPEMMLCIVRVL